MSRFNWNEETIQHFKFQSNYTGAKEVLDAVTSFVEYDCTLDYEEQEQELINDLMSIIYDSTKQNNKKRCNK